MATKMDRRRALMVLLLVMSFIVNYVHGERSSPVAGHFSGNNYGAQMKKMQSFKGSFLQKETVASLPSVFVSPNSPAGHASSSSVTSRSHEYRVTSYGADPTGKIDSVDAIIRAISDAFEVPVPNGYHLFAGIKNLGGVAINLEGGTYSISRPIKLPIAGRGNFKIYGGTLKASSDFPTDGYLLDISAPSSSSPKYEYDYELVTLRDLMLDSNFRGGGIQVINSLRTSIDNCYIAHFTTNGVLVQYGHETYIRNSFLGQHITAGAHPKEREFSGTAINIMGNDNSITDVVIFSAATGIIISGQANLISGVHCYNKATGFGGKGIYLKLPGLTQTRIVNSYLDYTGIVAEDPVQLHITGCFFLGDANIVLKSVHGLVNGVNIVDNMFSGSARGTNIVHLDQSNGPFKNIDQVIVDRNNVKGMNLKATVARGSIEGHKRMFSFDFNWILLFSNRIKHVQYTISTTGGLFPSHAIRNVSDNRVVVETDVEVYASVFVAVNQGDN